MKLIRPLAPLAMAGAVTLFATGAAGQPAPAAPAAAEESAEESAEEEEEEPGAEEGEPPPAAPAPTGEAEPGFQPLPTFPRAVRAGGSGTATGSKAGKAKRGKKKADDADESDKTAGADEKIYAEDWWSHARPLVEMHGYFRVRAELFHNFSLSRIDNPNDATWPRPIDEYYDNRLGTGPFGPVLCTGDESDGASTSTDISEGAFPCRNRSQAGANMRFRLSPELHISDNLRVMSQIDLLDNLVLGSTPVGYSTVVDGSVQTRQRGGYAPLGAFDTTQEPPSAGVNGLRDSIRVKRAWAEYLTPVGMLRFGRMPSHWGLGILANSGDGYDDDYASTADRIMFFTGVKSLDLYVAGAWDFPNEGATSQNLALPQQQPYDLAQLDDVSQYVLVVVRKTNPELQKLRLRQGNLVLNGGAYVVHRRQLLANDAAGGEGQGRNVPGSSAQNQANASFVRRNAVAWIPDVWVQALYKKFRFEAELATIQGDIEDIGMESGGGEFKLNQWGLATEIEQRLVEDRLKLEFKFGYATGDADLLRLAAPPNGLDPQLGDDTISTFRFHPNYKIDLILNRNYLTRIQGSYYFNPNIEYDFLRKANGQRFGGGAGIVWTRASEFVQTPGHDADLGVELDTKLYFQSADGSLNDDPTKMGGFYTMLQWGVLFPLQGLGYQEGDDIVQNNPKGSELGIAQTLRWYMGVMF